MNEPLSFRGNVLDRKKYEEMRDEYHELRGWDMKIGLQKEDTLKHLDMGDLAKDLKEMGWLAA